MMRGQAFDTFKLMIAAVVAVAILGILLSILGGISFSGQEFGNAAQQLLQTCSSNPPMGKPSPGRISFQKGSTYPESMFTTASGGRDVYFNCGSLGTGLCQEITTGSGSRVLSINGNFKSKLHVCCNTTSGSSDLGPCTIGIGVIPDCE